MRYKELLIGKDSIRNQSQIENILKSKKFYWLIDSEIEDSILEIKNDTLIWHEGIFYAGKWKYGIFKNGKFFGNWENGIFEKGDFKGEWKSGIRLDNLN